MVQKGKNGVTRGDAPTQKNSWWNPPAAGNETRKSLKTDCDWRHSHRNESMFRRRDGSGLGMAGVLHFGPLRQEALAAILTAAGEAGAAIFGRHAGAEAVLIFKRARGGLEGAFGHDGAWLG